MPSDRLTGFSSVFDEMLERSRRELDALSGGSDAPALSPTPRTSSRSSSRTSFRTPPRTSSEPAGSRPSATRPSTTARDGSDRSARTAAPAPRSPSERALDEKLGSGIKGRAGNVSFTLGARTKTGPGTSDPARNEREAERQAVESALAACARLL